MTFTSTLRLVINFKHFHFLSRGIFSSRMTRNIFYIKNIFEILKSYVLEIIQHVLATGSHMLWVNSLRKILRFSHDKKLIILFCPSTNTSATGSNPFPFLTLSKRVFACGWFGLKYSPPANIESMLVSSIFCCVRVRESNKLRVKLIRKDFFTSQFIFLLSQISKTLKA